MDENRNALNRPRRTAWWWTRRALLVLLALVLFGIFFAAPLGLIIAYSFWKVVDYNVVHDWTLDNYRYFFSVGTYARTFWATIWVSVAATALAIFDLTRGLVARRLGSEAGEDFMDDSAFLADLIWRGLAPDDSRRKAPRRPATSTSKRRSRAEARPRK